MPLSRNCGCTKGLGPGGRPGSRPAGGLSNGWVLGFVNELNVLFKLPRPGEADAAGGAAVMSLKETVTGVLELPQEHVDG